MKHTVVSTFVISSRQIASFDLFDITLRKVQIILEVQGKMQEKLLVPMSWAEERNCIHVKLKAPWGSSYFCSLTAGKNHSDTPHVAEFTLNKVSEKRGTCLNH